MHLLAEEERRSLRSDRAEEVRVDATRGCYVGCQGGGARVVEDGEWIVVGGGGARVVGGGWWVADGGWWWDESGGGWRVVVGGG